MTPKRKTVLLLAAIVLLLAAAYWQIWPKYKDEISQIAKLEIEQQNAKGVETGGLAQPEIKPATGDIDDIIDALLSESSSEQALVSDETKDSTLVSSDSQEIDAFMQIYDETEF